MDTQILNVSEPVGYEDAITKAEIHTYSPYLPGPYLASSEVRIPVQNQDIYTAPCNSYLRFRGTLTRPGNALPVTTRIVRNGILHTLNRISYELNGCEVDATRDVGITATIKNYLSLTHNQLPAAKMAGWGIEDDFKVPVHANGKFEVCIPLAMLLGFAEDYRHVIINSKQEIVMQMANTQTNAVQDTGAEAAVLSILSIDWLLPHVQVNMSERVKFLKYAEKGRNVDMAFRTWSLETYPSVPSSVSVNWNVKTSFSSEKPRYIIVAFQSAKRNVINKDCSTFDHVNIKNVKVYLNSEAYPYGDLNIDFANGVYMLPYQMYADFQRSYYDQTQAPTLEPNMFANTAPLLVFDVSKQDDRLKSGVVDCRIELTAAVNFPAFTQAYALIIHDRLVTYNVRDRVVKILT